MAIKFECQCGQNYSAKETMAGKAVKCRKCGQPVLVPEPSLVGAPEIDFTEIPDENENADESQDVDKSKCPECGAEMPDGAVLCTSCGYHQTLKTKIGQELPESMQAAEEDWRAPKPKEFKLPLGWIFLAGIFLLAIGINLPESIFRNVVLFAGAAVLGVIALMFFVAIAESSHGGSWGGGCGGGCGGDGGDGGGDGGGGGCGGGCGSGCGSGCGGGDGG